MAVLKFIAHSYTAIRIAVKWGWLPGARYSNLRDVRKFDRLGFLDIDWKQYDFAKHLAAARLTKPMMTVAQDVERAEQLDETIEQGYRLLQHADAVVIVPKDPRMAEDLEHLVPPCFMLGYSVPTRYGGTALAPSAFKRPVHLLGGRPDVQRALASRLAVASIDCNRFTLDAGFGDYFDGEIFRPHPVGGYHRCLEDSVTNINRLWDGYTTAPRRRGARACVTTTRSTR
jgi:hypothetical protein